jgi:nucleotide-binding universal stress UspA family protein
MKTIMLLVHDDSGQESRFQAALDVCRAIGGHLACLDVAILPNIVGDMYGATAMLLADERQRESALRTRLEERLRHEDVSWDWREATGEPGRCLLEAASLADLIVINRKFDAPPQPDMDDVASQVLTGSNKPVLAVPPGVHGVNLSGHALIAWDGSQVAASALRASVPLLSLAETVTILQVYEGTAASCDEDPALYLSRCGIASDIVTVPLLKVGTGSTLLAEVLDRKPDYVVMGGYGHSRLREKLLGGVSRSMLAESPVPLFISH